MCQTCNSNKVIHTNQKGVYGFHACPSCQGISSLEEQYERLRGKVVKGKSA